MKQAFLLRPGKHHWKHGVVAAKMKLPYGRGIWPAFWMLPEKGTWPDGGEIDIMELIGGGAGRDNKAYGTLHGPGYSGARGDPGKLQPFEAKLQRCLPCLRHQVDRGKDNVVRGRSAVPRGSEREGPRRLAVR